MSTVLSRAVAWWHADKHSSTDTEWLDQSGNGHNAQFGSGSGADSNDPTFLPYNGLTGVYVPSGDSATSKVYTNANSNARCQTNGVELIYDVACQWSAPNGYLHTMGNANNHWHSVFFNGNDGQLGFFRNAGGSRLHYSNANLPVGSWSDWDRKLIRVTADYGNGDVNFYYKDPADGGWTQLGTTVAGYVGSSGASGDEIRLCKKAGSSAKHAIFYDFKIYDDASGGTLQYHADFSTDAAVVPGATSFTEASANGYTVNLYRGNAIEPLVVNRNLFQFNGDDFFEVPDHANLDASSDFTAYIVFRKITDQTANYNLLSKKADTTGSGDGYTIRGDSGDYIISRVRGDSDWATSAIANSQEHGAGFVLDVTGSSDLQTFIDGTGTGSPDTSIYGGDTSNSEVLRIGTQSGSATLYHKGAVVGAAIFQEALSDADVVQLDAELKANHTGTVLSRAQGWWHADRYYPSMAKWEDQSGNDHHAQFGSTTGSDTNDPLFLQYENAQYMYRSASGPTATETSACRLASNAAVDAITGDFTIETELSVADYDLANGWCVAKYNGTTTYFGLSIASGQPRCWAYDGTATREFRAKRGSTDWKLKQRVGIKDNDRIILRAVMDASLSSGNATFWYKNITRGDSAFTQIGDARSAESGSGPYTWSLGTDNVSISDRGSDGGSMIEGKFYGARIYSDTTQTTAVMDVDFTNEANVTPEASSFVEDANGYTVNLYRGDTIEPVIVDRNMFLFEGDDYFEIADDDNLDFNNEDFTIYSIARKIDDLTAATAATLIDKGAIIGQGYAQWVENDETPRGRVIGGATIADQGTAYSGGGNIGQGLRVIGGGTATAEIIKNGVGTGSPGSGTGASWVTGHPLRFGSNAESTPAYFWYGQIIANAIFREALSDADLMGLHFELENGDYRLHPTIMDRAVAWWHTDLYSGSGDWLDQSPNGHDAQFGSTAGADSNDPSVLTFKDVTSLWTPDHTEDMVYTQIQTDLAPQNVDIEMVSRVRVPNLTTLSKQVPLQCAYTTNNEPPADNQTHGRFEITTAGNLWFRYYGSALRTLTSSATLQSVGFGDDDIMWVKVTLDYSVGEVKFYYADGGEGNAEPSSWTQLGTTQTSGDTTAPVGVTAGTWTRIYFGSDANASQAEMYLYRAIKRNGIGTAIISDVTTNNMSTEWWTSDSAAQAHPSGNVNLRTGDYPRPIVVNRRLMYLTTDDFFQISDHNDLDFGLNDSATLAYAARSRFRNGAGSWTPGTTYTFCKRSTSGAGWMMQESQANNGLYTDWFFSSTQSSYDWFDGDTDGTMQSGDVTNVMVRDRTADTIQAYHKGMQSATATTDALTATSANGHPVRIGASANGTNYHLGPIIGAAVVREAFTPTEVAALDYQLRSSLLPDGEDELGVASESLALTVSAAGSVERSAAASVSLALTVSAVSTPSVDADAAVDLALDVSATPSVERAGAADSTLAITAIADAGLDIARQAAVTAVVTADAVPGLDLGATASVSGTATAVATADIVLGGAALATLALAATATQTMDHSARATVTASLLASAILSLILPLEPDEYMLLYVEDQDNMILKVSDEGTWE